MIKRFLIVASGLILVTAACQPETREDPFESFMWVGAGNLSDRESKLLDNILAFAARHRIIPYESGISDTSELRDFLQRSKEHGIEKTWIEIGPRESRTGNATAAEFVRNQDQRAPTLQRFRRLANVYKKFYPDFARITIFDEAPLGAFAHSELHGKGSYKRDFDEFKQYGPTAFVMMAEALKEEMPNAEVGIFLHHPHNASFDMAGRFSYIDEFMRKADSLGMTPDFIFSDVYRGYINRGNGVELTNDYITDVVSHTGAIASQYGAEHYQLGQVHTIKLGYTPSRRQIDANVDAMLDGNPDGLGWYWPNYASTNYRQVSSDAPPRHEGYDVSFDPFVPNAWGKLGPAGSLYGTSRDRFSYSYLRIQEATEQLIPDRRFDLWIYGYDFDHVEHKLYLKAHQNDSTWWQFIGYFNPQQDRDAYIEEAREEYIYSYNDERHAIAFHGLNREKYITSKNGRRTLNFRITTGSHSDQSTVAGIYAMPYRQTRNYATESEITKYIEKHPRWIDVNSLAAHVRSEDFVLEKDTVFENALVDFQTAANN